MIRQALAWLAENSKPAHIREGERILAAFTAENIATLERMDADLDAMRQGAYPFMETTEHSFLCTRLVAPFRPDTNCRACVNAMRGEVRS